MRILVINCDYDNFLEDLYRRQPHLVSATYDEQLAARDATLFGVSDFYPRRLRALGHDAVEVHLNNERMQRAWAREHGIATGKGRAWQPAARVAGIQMALPCGHRWTSDILWAQIEDFKPEVVLTHDLQEPSVGFWKRVRHNGIFLAAQVASPMPRSLDPTAFDIILTSLPNFVEQFRARGVRSELFRLGFDPIVLDRLGPRPSAEHDVSFVGSVSPDHQSRVVWLEEIAAAVDVAIHANGANRLAHSSRVRATNLGVIWGIEMYRTLARSAITLNHHIGIAGPYANNMRLYEATGVGTLLVTDAKVNLRDMFEPDREVVVYRDARDCIAKVWHFLNHPDEAAEIAAAGQRRTMREHTYLHRMTQLVDILSDAA